MQLSHKIERSQRSLIWAFLRTRPKSRWRRRAEMCKMLLAGYCSRHMKNRNEMRRKNHSLGGALLVEVEAHRNGNEVTRSRYRVGCDRRVDQLLVQDVKTTDLRQRAKRMRQRWPLTWETSCSSLQILSGKPARSKWPRPWQISSKNAMPASQNGCLKAQVVNRVEQAARGVKIREAPPKRRLTRQLCSMRHVKDFLSDLQSPLLVKYRKSLCPEAATLYNSHNNAPLPSLDLWIHSHHWTSDLLRSSVARKSRTSLLRRTLALPEESDQRRSLRHSPSRRWTCSVLRQPRLRHKHLNSLLDP